MEYARMARGLLAALRREMNGAVVADMESRGLHYPRNYGVSQHTVRTAAQQLAPNHDFAKYLWKQSVRELKLAAVTIADPCTITMNEIEFWLNEVKNVELAENLASYLLSRTAHVMQIADTYVDSDNPLWVYTAILTIVKGYIADMAASQAIGLIERLKIPTPHTERAAALLLSCAASASERDRNVIMQYIDKVKYSGDYLTRRITSEIMI
jgi:3-methyladenine DNA glycosylase AlkD